MQANESNPRGVSGDKIFISPEGVAYELVAHAGETDDGMVVVKHLVNGDELRVNRAEFMSQWTCG